MDEIEVVIEPSAWETPRDRNGDGLAAPTEGELFDGILDGMGMAESKAAESDDDGDDLDAAWREFEEELATLRGDRDTFEDEVQHADAPHLALVAIQHEPDEDTFKWPYRADRKTPTAAQKAAIMGIAVVRFGDKRLPSPFDDRIDEAFDATRFVKAQVKAIETLARMSRATNDLAEAAKVVTTVSHIDFDGLRDAVAELEKATAAMSATWREWNDAAAEICRGSLKRLGLDREQGGLLGAPNSKPDLGEWRASGSRGTVLMIRDGDGRYWVGIEKGSDEVADHREESGHCGGGLSR